MAERNALGARSLLPDDNPLNAGAPTAADAWRFNADWLAQQRARSAQMGLLDPQTGLPTQAGWLDAANQYGSALMLGTTGPRTAFSLASKPGLLYNAPAKTPRPFEVDYPAGAPTDATGRLTADIEGRPLGAQFVAGRRTMGGGDEAITPAEFNALSEAAIGTRPEAIASGQLKGDAGRFTKTADPASGSAVYDIYTNRNLSPGHRDLATGHELGHMVDELAGQIDTKGLQPELGRVYNTLTTGQERTRGLTRPGDVGYGTEDIPREYMATAIHAYLTNPNYLKTVAPKVAAAIRAAVNAHPTLSKVIQFNAAGGLAYGAMSASDQPTN